jgi:hypothetical protein
MRELAVIQWCDANGVDADNPDVFDHVRDMLEGEHEDMLIARAEMRDDNSTIGGW